MNYCAEASSLKSLSSAVGKHSCWVTRQSARYDRCIGYVSVTVYVLALSSE
jgi:hypothetical protein